MAVLIEGVGVDWVVARWPGGRVEIHAFAEPADLPGVLSRLLAKAAMSPAARAPQLPSPAEAPSPPLSPRRRGRVKASRPPKLPLAKVNGARGKSADYDCQACGACCAPADPAARHYVALEGEDLGRFPKGRRTTSAEGGTFLLTKKHSSGRRVCEAFEGELGGLCSCSDYDRRPNACRLFTAGSPECLSARSRFGLSVDVA